MRKVIVSSLKSHNLVPNDKYLSNTWLLKALKDIFPLIKKPLLEISPSEKLMGSPAQWRSAMSTHPAFAAYFGEAPLDYQFILTSVCYLTRSELMTMATLLAKERKKLCLDLATRRGEVPQEQPIPGSNLDALNERLREYGFGQLVTAPTQEDLYKNFSRANTRDEQVRLAKLICVPLTKDEVKVDVYVKVGANTATCTAYLTSTSTTTPAKCYASLLESYLPPEYLRRSTTSQLERKFICELPLCGFDDRRRAAQPCQLREIPIDD
jgi:hypothetical protein